ncbi:MAG TPA: anti-sigma factor [Anaerolineae bacterium]|nr:anti-sigma factor [Anaerolineae bacterium]HMR66204.1 anti-sigma factor [Anaerolineae bacterium]
MGTELTYSQVSELLPAYALGALEPEEMLAVDAYLSNSQALVARLHDIELTVAQMAFAAPDVPLPTEAKSQLLARVQADLGAQASLETGAAPQTRPVARNSDLPRQQTSKTAQTGSWWVRLGLTLSNHRWLVATGCALMGLAVLGLYTAQIRTELSQVTAQFGVLQRQSEQWQESNAGLQQTVEDLQHQLETSHNQLQQASVTLDTLQTEAAELRLANSQLQEANQALRQQAQVNQDLMNLVASADRTVFLPGTDESPEASGVLYLNPVDQAVLVLRGLEPLPAEQTYQLWLIPADNAPQPAGLLEVETDGLAWLPLKIPATARDFAAVGVSVEPAGGSPAPSGPIVLLGTVG